MGKAVPKLIKQRANELIKAFPEKLSKDFQENKAFLKSLGMPFSKVEVNLMSGFIARKLGEKKD